MVIYTCGQYAEMILLYGANNFNAAKASREYAERHPDDDEFPSNRVILDAVSRLQRTGSVMPNHREAGRPRIARAPENVERVLECAQNNPERGIRGMAAELNMSYYAVQKILKDDKWHDYHLTRVQNLHPGDNLNRIRLLRINARNPNFFREYCLLMNQSSVTMEFGIIGIITIEHHRINSLSLCVDFKIDFRLI